MSCRGTYYSLECVLSRGDKTTRPCVSCCGSSSGFSVHMMQNERNVIKKYTVTKATLVIFYVAFSKFHGSLQQGAPGKVPYFEV